MSALVTGDARVCSVKGCPSLYTGPECYGFLTLFFILAMSALFNVFTAPYFFSHTYGVLAALIVVWVCTLVCVGAIIRLLFSDPGIVPRANSVRDQLDPVKKKFRERSPLMALEMPIRTFPLRCKFCEACNVYRAPRVTHCSSCDCCMERFDHHCPWLGTCVGRRNYATFLVFMISLTLSTLGMIAIAISHLALYTLDEYESSDNMGQSIQTTLANNIPVAILLGIGFLFMWFVVGLTAYHAYLSAHAMTTYEHIRGAFETIGNPFDQGGWHRNIWAIFTEPSRPSWVNLQTKKAHMPTKLDSVLESVVQPGITPLRTDSLLSLREPSSGSEPSRNCNSPSSL